MSCRRMLENSLFIGVTGIWGLNPNCYNLLQNSVFYYTNGVVVGVVSKEKWRSGF